MTPIVKKLTGEASVPPIESLVPELIAIAKEGGIEERIATLLKSKGYTQSDVHREMNSLGNLLDSDMSLSIYNRFQDIEHGTFNARGNNAAYFMRKWLQLQKRKNAQTK